MTPSVELGFIDKLRGELHGRIEELEGAVEELALSRAAYAAIGGAPVPNGPEHIIIGLRDEIRELQEELDVVEAERANLRLQLEDRADSAGGQNGGEGVDADTLATFKRNYESAAADVTALLTRQAQLIAERDEARALADSRGRELEDLHRELAEANVARDDAILNRGDFDWKWSPTNLPPGTPCGTAEARSNKGIGANAPYFISPSEQGLRDEFDIGHTWAVFKIHGNLLLAEQSFTPEDIAAIPPDESPAPEGDGGLSPEAMAVHGDQMERSAEAFATRDGVDTRTVASEVNTRKAPVSVTLEQARDYIVDVLGKDVEFPTSALAQWFNISDSQARDLCSKLAEQKIIVRPGAAIGRNARWKYNLEIPAGPTEKPRGERLLDVPAPRRGGAAVPGTGKPVGQAESPGKLKRQQGRAARVKTKIVKGVRT